MAEKERFELSLGFTPTTPLAGEPLRPLGYFSIRPAHASELMENGGERGIRTPGAFQHHWFSRPAPSTTRPSLRILPETAFQKHSVSIPLITAIVNPLMQKNQRKFLAAQNRRPGKKHHAAPSGAGQADALLHQGKRLEGAAMVGRVAARKRPAVRRSNGIITVIL